MANILDIPLLYIINIVEKRGFNLVIVQYGLTSEASIIHDNFDIVRCIDFPSRYLQLFRILRLISYRDLVVGGYGHFYLWIVRYYLFLGP